MRPLAINWPPERRAAAANGAAHSFSQMSTPAVLPGSIAAARCSTSSSAKQLRQLGLDSLKLSELVDIGKLRCLDRTVLGLGQDQYVDHADGPEIN